jgi:hypothetical protein
MHKKDMPEKSDTMKFIGSYDGGKHVLTSTPDTLLVCKTNVRVLAMSADNQTVRSGPYKPIILSYQIYHKTIGMTVDPSFAFEHGPNFPMPSFQLPDDGSPVFFILKPHLNINPRNARCSFPNVNGSVDEYSVFIAFGHDGWEDDGAGEHNEFHVEC